MAIRTSASDIREILPDETAMTDGGIEAFIEMASAQVDELDSTQLGTTKLFEIERWLTAHLITITKERRGVQEEVGEAKVRFSNIYGEGLMASEYGQWVAQLDTTGTLMALGKKKVVIVAVTSFE